MATAGQLRIAAEALRGASRDLSSSSEHHDAMRQGLTDSVERIPNAWSSEVSTVAVQRAETFVGLLHPLAPALGNAAASITALANEAAALADELLHHERAEVEAAGDLAAAQWQRSMTDPTDVVTLRILTDRERAAMDRQRAARSGIASCEQRWDAVCRRTAGDLRGAVVPVRGVSLQGPLWTPLDGRAAAGGGFFWPQLRDLLFGDVLTFWSGGDDRPPIGGGIAAIVRVARTAGWGRRGGPPAGFPTLANGGLGNLVARLPGMGWLTSPLSQRVLTRAGFVGGAFTGVTGTWDLIQHGNPVTAFQSEGAGYTADVGRTVFGFGTAGLGGAAILGVAAPPVLIVVTVGAGVVWMGSEVINHWDTIAGWADSAWDWTSGVASSAWNGAANLASDAWNGASDLAGDAWNGASDLAGGAVDSVTDTLADAPLVGGLFS